CDFRLFLRAGGCRLTRFYYRNASLNPSLLTPNSAMAKTDRLKSRLKSADKRRRRRLHSTAARPTETPTAVSVLPPVDVPALLAAAILATAQDSGVVRDSAAVAALRAIITGRSSNSSEAQKVQDAMSRALGDAEIPERDARAAAEELLDLALNSPSSDRPDQFLQYLSLINA
ncbi:MAG: hypothetical protein AAFU85_32975, partial [Planctomycetota bacterium]